MANPNQPSPSNPQRQPGQQPGREPQKPNPQRPGKTGEEEEE